jgi:PAS domain S-box-containing protein
LIAWLLADRHKRRRSENTSVAYDHPDLSRIEQSLIESELRFSNLADTAPVLIWMSDPDKQTIFFNQPWLEFRGRSFEQERGEGWAEGIHPDDLPDVLVKYHGAFDRRESFQIECRIRSHDGEYHWMLASGTPRFTPSGRFLGYIGTVIDISEMKNVESTLRFSEARYRAIVEDQTELICRLRPDGIITFVNETYARYFGFERPADLIGSSFEPFIPESEKESIDAFMAEFSPAKAVASIEHSVLLPNGDLRWHQWTDRAIYDDEGKLTEFQCIGRDITERKLAEEAFHMSQRSLRESHARIQHLASRLMHLQEEERGRIASELHDGLGQSLAIIRNRVTICLRDVTDAERVREQLEEIAETTSSTIEEVREIAHNLRPVELDRLGLIQAVGSMAEKVSRSGSIDVSLDLDNLDGLSTKETEISVYRIVQEGLNNLIKHSDATKVTVLIKRDADDLVVSVKDNGKGIDIGGNGNGRGGFGLASIEERCRGLGGSFVVDSQPGSGTSLTVRFGVANGKH